jgi:hypothetical protein
VSTKPSILPDVMFLPNDALLARDPLAPPNFADPVPNVVFTGMLPVEEATLTFPELSA